VNRSPKGGEKIRDETGGFDMSDAIQYAYRIDSEKETPCHLSEIKKGDVYYWVVGSHKSDLLEATGDAFSVDVNDKKIWSVPHAPYQ